MKDPLHTFFVERASKLVSNDDACVGISCALAVSAALGFDCDTTKRWVKLIAVALAAVKRRKLVLGIDIHTNFQVMSSLLNCNILALTSKKDNSGAHSRPSLEALFEPSGKGKFDGPWEELPQKTVTIVGIRPVNSTAVASWLGAVPNVRRTPKVDFPGSLDLRRVGDGHFMIPSDGAICDLLIGMNWTRPKGAPPTLPTPETAKPPAQSEAESSDSLRAALEAVSEAATVRDAAVAEAAALRIKLAEKETELSSLKDAARQHATTKKELQAQKKARAAADDFSAKESVKLAATTAKLQDVESNLASTRTAAGRVQSAVLKLTVENADLKREAQNAQAKLEALEARPTTALPVENDLNEAAYLSHLEPVGGMHKAIAVLAAVSSKVEFDLIAAGGFKPSVVSQFLMQVLSKRKIVDEADNCDSSFEKLRRSFVNVASSGWPQAVLIAFTSPQTQTVLNHSLDAPALYNANSGPSPPLKPHSMFGFPAPLSTSSASDIANTSSPEGESATSDASSTTEPAPLGSRIAAGEEAVSVDSEENKLRPSTPAPGDRQLSPGSEGAPLSYTYTYADTSSPEGRSIISDESSIAESAPPESRIAAGEDAAPVDFEEGDASGGQGGVGDYDYYASSAAEPDKAVPESATASPASDENNKGSNLIEEIRRDLPNELHDWSNKIIGTSTKTGNLNKLYESGLAIVRGLAERSPGSVLSPNAGLIVNYSLAIAKALTALDNAWALKFSTRRLTFETIWQSAGSAYYKSVSEALTAHLANAACSQPANAEPLNPDASHAPPGPPAQGGPSL
jgi:hypothetical protein